MSNGKTPETIQSALCLLSPNCPLEGAFQKEPANQMTHHLRWSPWLGGLQLMEVDPQEFIEQKKKYSYSRDNRILQRSFPPSRSHSSSINSLLIVLVTPDLYLTTTANHPNSHGGKKVVRGVGVRIDTTIEYSSGILTNSR